MSTRSGTVHLLENCADIYARCDANRRLCNQAFFTKVYIEEDDELRAENNRPFEMLLDPEVNANALNWAQNADKARTPANDSIGKGSSLVRGVGPRGIEPRTRGDKIHSFRLRSTFAVTPRALRGLAAVPSADDGPSSASAVESRG